MAETWRLGNRIIGGLDQNRFDSDCVGRSIFALERFDRKGFMNCRDSSHNESKPGAD